MLFLLLIFKSILYIGGNKYFKLSEYGNDEELLSKIEDEIKNFRRWDRDYLLSEGRIYRHFRFIWYNIGDFRITIGTLHIFMIRRFLWKKKMY